MLKMSQRNINTQSRSSKFSQHEMQNRQSHNDKLKNLKKMINTVPNPTNCALTPPPIRTNGDVFFKKRCRYISSGSGTISVTIGNYLALLPNIGSNTRVRLLSICAWNTTNQTNTSNFIKLSNFNSILFTVNPQTTYAFEDAGLNPRLKIEFPESSMTFLTSANSASNAFDISLSVAGTNVQSVVLDLILQFDM
jgi:hypothetical protein